MKKIVIAVLCCIALVTVGMVLGNLFSIVPLSRIHPVQYEYEPIHTEINNEPTTATETNSSLIIEQSSFSPIRNAAVFGRDLLTLPELFTGANEAVVAISTETTQRNFFGQVVTLPAAGSGFIVSADGYIVTNDHVIENANRITVMLYDGSIYPASVVGRYRAGDLAVLRIESENLSFLTFGNSDEIMVGEQVAAIGNPLGELSNSMTVGHISGLDRDITIGGITLTMIQTDASVNSGNSGGPLLNLRGQVIGVVTARAGGSAGGLTVEGLGFAIPSNIAEAIKTRLMAESATPNASTPQTPTQNVPTTPSIITPPRGTTPAPSQSTIPLRNWDLGFMVEPQEVGGQVRLRVTSVNAESGAAASNLAVGDIIQSMNGTSVSTLSDFLFAVFWLEQGDTLTIRVSRNGTVHDITGTIQGSGANLLW